MAHGQKPNKFNFNLATKLLPDDIVRMEFHTISMKKKRRKMIAMFEVMLETLIDSKYIDLAEENLSDINNSLMVATVQLKLYYTPPDIEEQNAVLGLGAQGELVDWRSLFDDEGRHGGHRSRYVHSKKDSEL